MGARALFQSLISLSLNPTAEFTPIPPQDAVSIAELLQCLRDKSFAESLLVHQVLLQVSCAKIVMLRVDCNGCVVEFESWLCKIVNCVLMADSTMRCCASVDFDCIAS